MSDDFNTILSALIGPLPILKAVLTLFF